jgi:hypothetical protein
MNKSYVGQICLHVYIICDLLLRFCGRYLWQRLRSISLYMFFCQLGAFRMESAKNACGICVYYGTDYTFPILFMQASASNG